MANAFHPEEFNQQTPECLLCEEMLADVLDETLVEGDQIWFDRHVASCGGCSRSLVEARRGAALLDLLRMSPPEPSASLFDRIISQTSGGQTSAVDAAPIEVTPPLAPIFLVSQIAPQTELPTLRFESLEAQIAAAQLAAERAAAEPSNLLPFRPRRSNFLGLPHIVFDTRLAMTAAMAFFSIALTLNLAGVHLNEVHASALKPQNLRRGFFAVQASAVRSYDNLRMVHVLESRVDALREDDALRQNQQQDRRRRQEEEQRQAAPVQQNRNEMPGNELPGLVPATRSHRNLYSVSFITSPASLPVRALEATKDLS